MKKLTIVSLTALLLVATLVTLVPAPAVAASGTAFSFTLTGPSTSEDPSTGDTIRVTGSGSFDTDTGSVTGGGSFTHFNVDGSVFAKGTWVATAFGSFDSFGGPHPGFQGGVLWITVTLFPNGGGSVVLPMSVTCEVNSPGGFEEGITVGPFTEKISGRNLLHMN